MADVILPEGDDGDVVRIPNFCCRPRSIAYNENVQGGKADMPSIQKQLQNAGDIDG